MLIIISYYELCLGLRMKARKAYEYFQTASLLPSSGVDLEMS